MLKLGLCVTGSFCSMKDMLLVLDDLIDVYEIEVFLTPHVYKMDTRFYNHEKLIEEIESRIHKKIHTSIQDAEIYGPFESLDIVLIYPCSASTMAKIDMGINDNGVTMLVKSSLRHQTPIVLGVYSNDILSQSGVHLLSLMNKKNFYFVPMYQDDYIKKPNSVIACHSLVKETLVCALKHQQKQPFLLGYKEV